MSNQLDAYCELQDHKQKLEFQTPPESPDTQILRSLLWKKILKVMEIAGGMTKDGKNVEQKYQFISSEQIVTKVRSALVKVGITFIPEVMNVEREKIETVIKHGDRKGQTRITYRQCVTMFFHPVDTETGFRDNPIQWMGEDTDSSKALAQAITEAHKRFLSKTLFISQPDDEDPDTKTTDLTLPKTKTKVMKAIFYHSPKSDEDKKRIFDTYADRLGSNPEHWPEVEKHKFSEELDGPVIYDLDPADALFDSVGEKDNSRPERFENLASVEWDLLRETADKFPNYSLDQIWDGINVITEDVPASFGDKEGDHGKLTEFLLALGGKA